MDIKSLQTVKRAMVKTIQDQFHFLMADVAKKQFPPGTEVIYKLDHQPVPVRGIISNYMANEPHLAMVKREGGAGDTIEVWKLDPVKPFFVEREKIESILKNIPAWTDTHAIEGIKQLIGE